MSGVRSCLTQKSSRTRLAEPVRNAIQDCFILAQAFTLHLRNDLLHGSPSLRNNP